MADISKDEIEMLEKSRMQTFRLYHVRTLSTVLKLLKEKKIKAASEYLSSEIYSVKSIKNSEFAKLIDALTLQIKLKENNENKNDSSPR